MDIHVIGPANSYMGLVDHAIEWTQCSFRVPAQNRMFGLDRICEPQDVPDLKSVGEHVRGQDSGQDCLFEILLAAHNRKGLAFTEDVGDGALALYQNMVDRERIELGLPRK